MDDQQRVSDDPASAERALFARYRATRDAALLALIVERQRGWVRHLAGRYRALARAHGYDLEDVIQSGFVGVMEAMQKYDETRGLRFRTLAEPFVRGAMLELVGYEGEGENTAIEEQPTIPLPAITLTRLTPPTWLQDRITRELEALPSSGPSVEEQVSAAVDGAQVSATLEAALLLLSEHQRIIIERRYGLGGRGGGGDGIPWTLEEVGRLLGRHRSNIYRQQQKALAVLRAHLATTADGAVILHALEEKRKRRARKRAAA